MLDKVAVLQVFLQVIKVSRTNIIPPVLHIHVCLSVVEAVSLKN
jgi:hypothetical protein